MTTYTSKEPQLNRDSWLLCALEVLRQEGIQGVRVERLARDLGVTKGSFYWHFQDREDLLQSIVNYWDKRYTDVVVENPDLTTTDPATGLLELMVQVRKQGLDEYELAMRAWADHDREVSQAVRTVYKKRNQFVRNFFTRLGFHGLEAEVRTRLALCYLSWEPNMYPDEPDSKRVKLVALQHKLLTSK